MRSRQEQKAHRAEVDRNFRELSDIRISLSQAYDRFNATTDPDLVDAYIFEINALRARYNTALRRCRNASEE